MTALVNKENERILSVHCPSCGAPAEFDIRTQTYTCGFCGTHVTADQALEEKRGFRKMHQEEIQKEQKHFDMKVVSCSGCGSRIIFPKGEPLSTCSFCGRPLVRASYLKTDAFPELVIPFRITLDEAKGQIEEWISKNASRKEAKHIREKLNELQGYYLPYELVRGPLTGSVSRDEGILSPLKFKGFLEGSFINTSSQLNNLVLNGMEPYDLKELHEFDFSYVAGQKIKVRDIDEKRLSMRVENETASDYAHTLNKVLETKSLYTHTNTENLMELPVLLPVYFIRSGRTDVAVNGQTGKVAVGSEALKKEFPWQLRLIGLLLITAVICIGGVSYYFKDFASGIYGGGIVWLVFALIFYTAFHNEYGDSFRSYLPQEIFTSKKKPLVRENGVLKEAAQDLETNTMEPIFVADFEGTEEEVTVRYTSPLRLLAMIGRGLLIAMLPVIFATIYHGFNITKVDIGPAFPWWLICIVVMPAYFLVYGRFEIYSNPFFYVKKENGSLKRKATKDQKDTSRVIWIVTGVLAVIAALNALLM